ncbi:MAG: hypothetical protein ACI4JQ_05005 [Ruminococcus sp.]
MKPLHVILLILGLGFMGISLVVGGILAVVSSAVQGSSSAVFLLIPALFFLVGCAFTISVFISIAKTNQIRKKGTRYAAKIYSYVKDYSVMVNGKPQINLKVRYYTGQVKEALIPTGFASGSQKYPIGYTMDIFEYRGKFSWDSTSVRNEQLPHEEELMSDKPVEPEKLNIVAVTCNCCGATYQAAAGYTNRCPYCGNYINT